MQIQQNANPVMNFDPTAPQAAPVANVQNQNPLLNFDPLASRSSEEQAAKVQRYGQKYVDTLAKDKIETSMNPGAALLAYGANVSQAIPFSDEIMSAVGAGFGGGEGNGISERYNDLQMRQQALRQAGKETQPRIETPKYLPDITPTGIGDTGANLLAAAVPIGVATKAKTISQAVRQGAAMGAGYGAAYGAGDTDSTLPTADAMEERALNAVKGGGLGAVLGAGAPAIIRGAQITAGKSGDMVNSLVNAVRGVKPEPKPSTAVKALSDYSLGMDQDTPQGLISALREQKGQPITLADVSGPNAQTALEQATQTQGRGMADAIRFFEGRNQEAPTRLAGVIEDNIGPIDYGKQIADLQDQMGSDAVKQGYKDAFAAGPKISGDQINKVLNRLDDSSLGKQVWANAQEMAKADGVDFAPRIRNGAVRDLSTQQLDYLKKSADDLVGSLANNTDQNITKSKLRNLSKWTANLRDAIDEANPAYAEARAKFGEPASAKAAMENGKSYLRSGDWTDLLDQYGGPNVNANEKKGFISGIARDLLERVKSQGGESPLAGSANPSRNVATDPNVRERLNALIGEAKAGKFLDDLAAQAKMQDVGNKAINNSATFRRAAAAEDINRRSMSVTEKLRQYGKQFNVGSPASWIGALGEKLSAENKAAINDEITRLMTNPDYRTNMQTIYQLSRAQALSKAEQRQLNDSIDNVARLSPVTGRLLLRSSQESTGDGQ